MLNGRQILIGLAIKFEGNWDKIYKSIFSNDLDDVDEYVEQFNRSTCNAVTIMEKEYPQILKQIYNPPFVLFYYGDLSLAYNPSKCLSIIGTRKPSEYGIKMATTLAEDLSNEFVTRTRKRKLSSATARPLRLNPWKASPSVRQKTLWTRTGSSS